MMATVKIKSSKQNKTQTNKPTTKQKVVPSEVLKLAAAKDQVCMPC